MRPYEGATPTSRKSQSYLKADRAPVVCCTVLILQGVLLAGFAWESVWSRLQPRG